LDITLDNIVGRGIKEVKLNGTYNDASSGVNEYDIEYDQKDDSSKYVKDTKVFKIINGRGISKIETTENDYADHKQTLNIAYSDDKNPDDVKIPVAEFRYNGTAPAIKINGTADTGSDVNFTLTPKNDFGTGRYGYELGITGGFNIYAPVGSGSSNQVLISNGANTAPTWTNHSNSAFKATTSTLGTVKITNNNGLSIDSNGVVAMALGSTGTAGAVKVTNGNGLSIDSNGTITKAADDITYISDGTGNNQLKVKLNGATNYTVIDIVIDDGEIQ